MEQRMLGLNTWQFPIFTTSCHPTARNWKSAWLKDTHESFHIDGQGRKTQNAD
jgi:hypothetical protein